MCKYSDVISSVIENNRAGFSFCILVVRVRYSVEVGGGGEPIPSSEQGRLDRSSNIRWGRTHVTCQFPVSSVSTASTEMASKVCCLRTCRKQDHLGLQERARHDNIVSRLHGRALWHCRSGSVQNPEDQRQWGEKLSPQARYALSPVQRISGLLLPDMSGYH